MELELKSSAVTAKQFVDSFLACKEANDIIEPSTIKGYGYEAGPIERYTSEPRDSATPHPHGRQADGRHEQERHCQRPDASASAATSRSTSPPNR